MAKKILFSHLETMIPASALRNSVPSWLFLVARELFYFSSLTLVSFVILENIFPRIILVYFNINYLFLLVILSGLITLIRK